jgi:hypothetical protein
MQATAGHPVACRLPCSSKQRRVVVRVRARGRRGRTTTGTMTSPARGFWTLRGRLSERERMRTGRRRMAARKMEGRKGRKGRKGRRRRMGTATTTLRPP